MISRIFLIISFIIGLAACTAPTTSRRTSEWNTSFIYHPSRNPFHPEFKVYHESDQSSQLMVKLFPVELLFNQANPLGVYMAQVRVHYQLIPIPEGVQSKMVVDSSSITFRLKLSETDDLFIAKMPIKAKHPNKYFLKVFVHDMLKDKVSINYLTVDKSNRLNEQNFLLYKGEQDQPGFMNTVSSNQYFRIRYNRTNIDSVYVKYYKETAQLPAPPYLNQPPKRFNRRYDSIYTLKCSDTTRYLLADQGVYLFQINPRDETGLTLYNFGPAYPRIEKVNDMLGPMSYLTSSLEFNELANSKNLKLAIDEFWLNASGNIQRARELIRVYFNRVYFANYYFTTTTEGWKTDRGMVYVIYGPPDDLNKSFSTETWIYRLPKSERRMLFEFERQDHPLSVEHFVLAREKNSNTLWRQAIQTWRSGKVYDPGS